MSNETLEFLAEDEVEQLERRERHMTRLYKQAMLARLIYAHLDKDLLSAFLGVKLDTASILLDKVMQ